MPQVPPREHCLVIHTGYAAEGSLGCAVSQRENGREYQPDASYRSPVVFGYFSYGLPTLEAFIAKRGLRSHKAVSAATHPDLFSSVWFSYILPCDSRFLMAAKRYWQSKSMDFVHELPRKFREERERWNTIKSLVIGSRTLTTDTHARCREGRR